MKKCKLILTTLCCLVGLGCFFCNADLITYIPRTSYSIAANSSHNFTNTGVDITCFMHNVSSSNNLLNYNTGLGKVSMTQATLYCFTGNVTIYNDRTTSTSIYYYSGVNNYLSGYFSGQCPSCPTIDQNYCVNNNLCPSCPSCPTCPDQYTSLECQSEYSLIPVSSVDMSYCVNNNLCPSGGGGECESGSVNWSSIYVNNIQHIGKPNIFITIPEEIDWDYTNNTGSFDLDIIGYNVDYQKMGEILEVQNYKPSSEDFTNLVGLLAPYMSILVFALFCFIVIRRLKKPFSSKLK